MLNLLHELTQKQYYECPNCHEHYEFSARQVRQIVRHYGQLTCYYCQNKLKKMN